MRISAWLGSFPLRRSGIGKNYGLREEVKRLREALAALEERVTYQSEEAHRTAEALLDHIEQARGNPRH